MTTLNTSSERIDALTYVSDQIYPILEQDYKGETRARQIMRLGIASVAIALRRGDTPSEAGAQFDGQLAYELRDVDYGAYMPHRTVPKKLSRIVVPHDIRSLADLYSDTLRGTLLADYSPEPDSIHALHLAALAVPYARAHYPDLESGKVALYSLIHDLPEAYAGDTPTFKISQEELKQKQQKESQAIEILKRGYEDKWYRLIETVELYEALADDEAKFVKSIDKNDPGYTHFRNGAYALRVHHNMNSRAEFKAQSHTNLERTLSYVSQFPHVLTDRLELTDRISTLLEQP